MADSNKDGTSKNQDLSMQKGTEKPKNFTRRLKPYNIHKTEFSDGELDLNLSLGGPYAEILSENPLMDPSSFILHENVVSFSPDPDLQITRRIETVKWLLERPDDQKSGTGFGGFEVGETSQPQQPQGAGVLVGEAVSVAVSPPPPPAPVWAAESASKNVALRRALQILKSEGCLFDNTAIITQGSKNLVVAKAGRVDTCLSMIIPGGVMKNDAKSGAVNPVNVPAVISTSGSTIANGKSIIQVEINDDQLEINPSKKAKCCNNEIWEWGHQLMKSMPSVSTTGGVPNGRKIEGFLYKYATLGQLCIVCICHGSFFTPEEFVKHAAGGVEVDNPLKFIKMSGPSST